jgi:hypothetical protein
MANGTLKSSTGKDLGAGVPCSRKDKAPPFFIKVIYFLFFSDANQKVQQ